MIHKARLDHVVEVCQTAADTRRAFDALKIPQVHTRAGNFAALEVRQRVDRVTREDLIGVQNNAGRQIDLVLLVKLRLHRGEFLGDLIDRFRNCARVCRDKRRRCRNRLTWQFRVVEDRGHDADVAQTQFDALKNAFRLHDRAAIAFLPVHLIVAGHRQTLVDLRNKEVRELFHPERARRIAVDHDRFDRLCRKGRSRDERRKRQAKGR